MGRFLKWIVNIILLCAIVVAAALLVPPLAGVTTVMIDRVDMDTNLSTGSVTYARSVNVGEIEVGDDVLISEGGSDYVYRVKSLDTSDGTCRLEDTKTSGSDEVTQTFRNEVSKVILTVPFIGYIPMAMRSTEGLIVIGLAVVFVIILFVLAELWRPDREDDPEEEEDEEEGEGETAPRREAPVRMDTPSQIMEEASNEIASVVSSVVAEETQQDDGWADSAPVMEPVLQQEIIPQETEEDSELDEIDRKLRDGSGYQPEEGILRDDDMEEPAEDAVILSLEEDMREEDTAEDGFEELSGTEESDLLPEQEAVIPAEEEAAQMQPEEETAEEAVQMEETEVYEEAGEADLSLEPETEAMEDAVQDEAPVRGQKLAMPLYTADELLAKAREKGEEPKVVKDENSGVTILDYSDLL